MPTTRHSSRRRLAGILAPLFSLRSERDLGIGDLASLREFVSFAAEAGFGFVQLLPVNETGPDNSPYNAISSVAIEPTTLDCTPDGLADLTREDFDLVLDGRAPAVLNEGSVNYAAVRELKQELLRRAYDRFMETVYGRLDLRAEAFDAFCQSEAAWLNDYCVFRILMQREGGSQVWQQWREAYRQKESALAALAEEAADPDRAAEIDHELRYYAYVQWVASIQWREMAEWAAAKDVALMGDIPFGVSLYSADVWANLDLFNLNWYGGAPPETLFKDDEFVQKWGQNWGIPLYRWEIHEASGFAWWRQRIAKTVEIFALFRIDHALGFYRIYSFPWNPVRNEEFLPLDAEEAASRCEGRRPGFRPRGDDSEENKALNRADGEKFLRMIQDAAGKAEVVAEDLGTVPDYVRPSLEALGIAGMKVPQWEFTEGHVTSGLHYPALSFATYATHDHAPVQAQWAEAHRILRESEHESHEWWEARNFLATLCTFAGIEMPHEHPPEFSLEVWDRLLRELCFSHSDRVALMITDLLGETERINVPGIMEGRNWSYRLPATGRDLTASPEYSELREQLKNVLKESARSRR